MPNSVETAEVAIVGGGPVGLAMACCLAQSGLTVVLLDAADAPESLDSPKALAGQPEFDPRVSALTVASQRLLERLDVWPSVIGIRACPYYDMEVWDGEGTGIIRFSCEEVRTQTLGHIVENGLLTTALDHRAHQFPALRILRPRRLERIERHSEAGRRHRLHLEGGDMVTADLLIGADGAHSLIREQTGFRTRQWDYGHQAIVATVQTQNSHQYTARQRFMASGPLAFLPLQVTGLPAEQQKYSSIVWSCVADMAERVLALPDKQFMAQLAEAFEQRLGHVQRVSQRFSFPLWQRHATDYVQQGIALIGDAAHTIHPLAGQGVNLGLADVVALDEVLRQARGRGEEITSHQVLSRYQRRRKGANLAMMTAMEGFKRLFASNDLGLRWLRNTGLSVADNTPFIKRQLMQHAMGIR